MNRRDKISLRKKRTSAIIIILCLIFIAFFQAFLLREIIKDNRTLELILCFLLGLGEGCLGMGMWLKINFR